ncbi:hypothetical protein HanPSC8_Chr17g0765911 [Helianthus annuus]|nr:hypothetical protein HanPSC8_Chr17g0765911 [Helianthus annuus]
MSAFLSAGASFTPSPVIPHICFLACKRFTISYLCSERHQQIHQLFQSTRQWVRRQLIRLCSVPVMQMKGTC